MGLPGANFRKCFGTDSCLQTEEDGQTMPTDATSNDIFSKICAELWLQLFLGNCSWAKFNYSLSHTHWYTHTHSHTYGHTYLRTCHVRWGTVARQAGRQTEIKRQVAKQVKWQVTFQWLMRSCVRANGGGAGAKWHSLLCSAQLSSAQLSSALLHSSLLSVHRLSCSAPVHATKYCCHCVA